MSWIKAIREAQGYTVSSYSLLDKPNDCADLLDEKRLKQFLVGFFTIYNPQKIEQVLNI